MIDERYSFVLRKFPLLLVSSKLQNTAMNSRRYSGLSDDRKPTYAKESGVIHVEMVIHGILRIETCT